MTNHETLDKLADMRLHGLACALREQIEQNDKYADLAFDERIGLMVDREWTEREARSLTRRLQLARLRDKAACIEDIDHKHPRGLDRSLVRQLATCQWLAKHLNCLVTGKTGCGKTYLACALGNKACRQGHSVIYRRLPRLLHELEVARADGSYSRLLARLAKTELLILDDWGMAPLGEAGRRDILEVVEDRHDSGSTLIASQLPVATWHTYIAEPTMADAILDRLVHNAYKIELSGGSIRKTKARLTQEGTSDK